MADSENSQWNAQWTYNTLYHRNSVAAKQHLEQLDLANVTDILTANKHFISLVEEEDLQNMPHLVSIFLRGELANQTVEEEFSAFQIGWAAFSLFIHVNWFRTEEIPDFTWATREWSLIIDGEDLEQQVKCPFLLAFSEELFLQLQQQGKHFSSHSWWRFRALVLHQQLLYHPTQTLKDEIDKCVKMLESFDFSFESSGYLYASLCLEIGWFNYDHFHFELAKSWFEKAAKSTGMVYEKTAILGKRTKFQIEAKAQLVVVGKSRDVNPNEEWKPSEDSDLPVEVILEDENLLKEIAFEEDAQLDRFVPLDQCALLGLAAAALRLHRVAHLSEDEQAAYISRILRHPQAWCVQLKALLLRSYGEIVGRDKLIRAIQQFEAILVGYETIKRPLHCFDFLFQTGLQSYWAIHTGLGDAYFEKHMNQSALAVYEKIGNLSKQCECLSIIGRKEDAQKLVKSLLEEEPTALLYCILGDVTNDDKHYDEAWEFSNKTYVRAIRSKANCLFTRKEFDACIPFYEEAVEINRYFPIGWTRLADCYMKREEYDKACNALSAAVSISPDDFKVWNDLAAVHMHLERWRPALHALGQAARLKVDSWRIWENVITCSIHVQDPNQLLTAMDRLIDLQENIQHSKDKWHLEQMLQNTAPPMQPQVFGIMAHLLTSGKVEENEDVIRFLRDKFEGLIVKTTKKYKATVQFWDVFATYYATLGKFEEAIEHRTKEYRELMRQRDKLEPEEAYKCIGQCLKELISHHSSMATSSGLFACKTSVTQFRKKVVYDSLEDRTLLEEVEALLEELSSKIKKTKKEKSGRR